MNRIQTPAHKGIVIALLPFSTLAALAKLDADDRAQAIPAARLTGISLTDDGTVQLAWINPNVEIGNDGADVEISIDGYKPGINNVLLLDGGGRIIIEDDKLDIDDGKYLTDAVLPLIVTDNKMLGTDDDSIANLPTPAGITDRVRVISVTGEHFVIDTLAGKRLSASLAYDEATGAEHVIMVEEGGNTVIAAPSAQLSNAEDAITAASYFTEIDVIDGKKIVRLAKPDDGKVEISYVDGSQAYLSIEDGTLKVEAKDTDAEANIDVTEAIEARDEDVDAGTHAATAPKAILADDVVGSPWEVIGLTGAVKNQDGSATRASVRPTPTGISLRFEKKQGVQAAT